jgi:hypothetical protein
MAQRSSKSRPSKSAPNEFNEDDDHNTVVDREILDTDGTQQQDDISPVRVLFLGAMLLATGALGFYTLPGMLADDAQGSRMVNSIYCSAITLTT